jgi:NADP-dependent 3-hydroxy acid dehydrogenase YdfG
MAESKTAVVTGASSGIGRAIALALAGRGHRVCLVGRDTGRLAAAAAEAEGAAKIVTRSLDLTDGAARAAFVAEVGESLGGADILVHAAGVLWFGEENAEVQMATNYEAPKELTRAFLPQLVEHRGEVVFINSTSGLNEVPAASAYSRSKQKLREYADELRREVNAEGVRVLSVYPGRTATPMQAAIFDHEERDYPPERLMQPEDVAAIVLAAIELPRTAEVIDLTIRPMNKV